MATDGVDPRFGVCVCVLGRGAPSPTTMNFDVGLWGATIGRPFYARYSFVFRDAEAAPTKSHIVLPPVGEHETYLHTFASAFWRVCEETLFSRKRFPRVLFKTTTKKVLTVWSTPFFVSVCINYLYLRFLAASDFFLRFTLGFS